MPVIFSKNCIVGGELDCYCLACCELLLNAENAMAHIKAATHKHNLSELPYADKYKDDFIRKARGVYFCEVCAVTLPTAAKVGMHVTEATHVAGKTRRQLKRAGTAIVFQENTLVTERAWNGLVDDTCVLCNAEFDDESTHKSQQSHILNLINSSVTAAGAANDIYRKIDGGYQCLTCNNVVLEDGVTDHSSSVVHNNAFVRYDQSQSEVNDVKNDDVKDEESKDGDTTANTEAPSADKKPPTSPVLIKEEVQAACSSDATEVETLAKQHGLSMNKGRSNVYCSACSVHVTATLDRINEHVDGKKHKKRSQSTALQTQAEVQTKKTIKKLSMQDFVDNIYKTKDINSEAEFLIINDAILLYFNKFLGLAMKNDKFVCLFCDIDLTEDNLSAHVSSQSHTNVLDSCLVISSLEDEFVREVRQDLYHCGYCGTVEKDLDDMLDHLDTTEHKECKDDRVEDMRIFKMQRTAVDAIGVNMVLNALSLGRRLW